MSVMRKPVSGFTTRLERNKTVQPKKFLIVRGLKFFIQKIIQTIVFLGVSFRPVTSLNVKNDLF